MMRVALASLALLATCCSPSVSAAPAGTIPAPGSAAAVARPAGSGPRDRAWRESVSPAPGDLALVRIEFRPRHAQRLLERSLRVAVSGPFGDDYLAVATPRLETANVARALILIVNRPSPLLDPLSVRLRVSALGSLGPPRQRTLSDPFTRPASGSSPALCDLLGHGRTLSGARLHALHSQGTALAGFDAAEAVAQAYDAACRLPYSSAFRHAIGSSSGGECPPGVVPGVRALCCPPTAICVAAPGPPPAPTPPPPVAPAPEPPHCAPCDPPPGYACPLAARPSVCAAPLRGSAMRASTGAH